MPSTAPARQVSLRCFTTTPIPSLPLVHCSQYPGRNSEAGRATALPQKVRSGPVPWLLVSWESTADHIPTESEHQSSRDFHDPFSDPTLGRLGEAGSPGPPLREFDPFRFTTNWLLETDMSRLPDSQLPNFNFGESKTSSMNEHLNPMISHTIAPQHQWDPANHEQTDHPINLRSAAQAPNGSSSTSSPPASPPQGIAPDPEPVSWAPTLTESNPESGSVIGGARIWLKGKDFPACFPLFARFGSAVVPTVSLMGSLASRVPTNHIPKTFYSTKLLACHLPPVTTPGVVDVSLSRHPHPTAPAYGTSIASFRYLGDQDQL